MKSTVKDLEKAYGLGDNHTIMIAEQGFNVWVSLLTSVRPGFREYRFTFSYGVVSYMTIDEVMKTAFSYISSELLKLTDHIDENRLGLYNGEMYVKPL